MEFGHWDRESCGTAITADGDLREQEEGAVVRQIVVPSIKRISSYLAEALRFAIAG